MKEQHKQTLDMMVRHDELVNEHALASQAAAFAREEEILKAKTPKEMEEEIKTMKEQHKQTLDMMIRTNVNEHALASQAAAFARKESEVENQLAAKMSANTLAVRLQPHGGQLLLHVHHLLRWADLEQIPSYAWGLEKVLSLGTVELSLASSLSYL